jgi:hypothetical protein
LERLDSLNKEEKTAKDEKTAEIGNAGLYNRCHLGVEMATLGRIELQAKG